MENGSEQAHRASRLHGRRTGKPLRAHQRELVRTYLPKLAVDLTGPLDLADLFGGSPREIWLEIGFGGGEHLIAAASADPDIGFIGCEPFLNGMARALTDLESRGLRNVRLHCGDASEVIAKLPDGVLDGVFLFYPDPWPKRRQRKRRFVCDEVLDALARVMRVGAELRFATDIDDYAGWTLARLPRSPHFEWTASRATDWQVPWPDWVETRYETKAKAQHRRPCYITARRIRSSRRSA